jgi:neutral ceramidase
MTVIKAVDQAGRELAVMNWFAVHPVSLPLENKLVSGDNKGLASYKLERQRGTTYQRDGEFVAGFFQANSGDISPYDISEPLRNATDYWQRLNESASRQAAKTEELLKTKGQALQVGLDARHQFVDLHGYEIDSRFTDGVATKTCLAALGVAFAAGTENGQPLPIFKEGTIYGVNWPEITLLPGEQACHEEKVILLPTGKIEGWTPHVLPYQLIRLGELAIVGAPFEITSMAGRRLKQHVQRALAPLGVRYVVLSALTNQYAHYVTTPEEYKTQNYEGGSTLFGPNTLAAHTQQFDRLAQAMVNGTTLDAGPQPANLENQKFQLQPGVVFDSAPRGQDYGAVASPPEPQYQAGDRVEVVFWGAHPKNDLKRGSSYIRVEYMGADGWQPLWFDWDPSTRVVWQRKGLAKSHWQVSWQSEPTAKPGRYRICHEGVAKPLFRGLRPYSGCTQGFELNGSASDVAQSPLGIR